MRLIKLLAIAMTGAACVLIATEVSAVVIRAHLIVVAKPEYLDLGVLSTKSTRIIEGRLRVASVLYGNKPNQECLKYRFECRDCVRLSSEKDLDFVRGQGIWFLRHEPNGAFTSAFPRSVDPGWRPLTQLGSYRELISKRRELEASATTGVADKDRNVK